MNVKLTRSEQKAADRMAEEWRQAARKYNGNRPCGEHIRTSPGKLRKAARKLIKSRK